MLLCNYSKFVYKMWKTTESIIYNIPKEFKFSSTVAIFNFYGTLIKEVKSSYLHTYSNKKQNYISQQLNNNIKKEEKLLKNPRSVIKQLYDNVYDKLLELHNNGASIIIYQSLKYENHSIKIAFDTFLLYVFLHTKIKIPIAAFFSTSKNKYSKPFTGMWDIINVYYTNKNKIINKSRSLIIGHKSGELKIKTKIYKKNNAKYYSLYTCADRAFAHNIGVSYITPDKFFGKNNNPIVWKWNSNILNQQEKQQWLNNTKHIQQPVIINEINSLPKSNKYTIIITGAHSCGKTNFAMQIKRKWDSDFINNLFPNNTCYNMHNIHIISDSDDILPPYYKMQDIVVNQTLEPNTLIKTLSEATDFKKIDNVLIKMSYLLKNNKSVIVDILHDHSNLLQIIKTSMIHTTPILIIEIQTNNKMAQLLDNLKVQTSNTYKTVLLPKYYWMIYIKKSIINYNTLQCVKHITYPLILKQDKSLWFEYC
jgi:gluconate kinase